MIRRPPRSTLSSSSAASDVYKRQFLSSSTQNHAESSRNYLNNLALDPKRAKLDQNSDFGHVRNYS